MSRKRPRVKNEKIDSLDKKVDKKEQEREDYDAFGFMRDKKQAAAIAGMFFIIGFAASWMLTPSMNGMVVSSQVNTDIDSIGEDGVQFINEYFVEDSGVTLKSVEDQGELLLVTTEYNGNEIPVYMTKDDKFIILGGIGAINMEEYSDQADAADTADTADTTDTPAATGAPKSDTPVVNAFVMSYCPYGLQMEKAILPVIDLLGDKADINIDYVHYIMHGEKEILQNNYQHCIEEEQPEVFVDYMTCFVQSDDHAGCMTEAGVDSAMLDACVERIDGEYNITGLYDDQSTWSGGRYPPYMVDAILANQYGVQGSPTLVINGQTVSVNRSPEALKQAICDSFNTPPEECSTTLSASAEAAGIGPLESGSATTSGSATCG